MSDKECTCEGHESGGVQGWMIDKPDKNCPEHRPVSDEEFFATHPDVSDPGCPVEHGTEEHIRHEDGQPHESHVWKRMEDGSRGEISICTECASNIEDDAALKACPYEVKETVVDRYFREQDAILVAVKLFHDALEKVASEPSAPTPQGETKK